MAYDIGPRIGIDGESEFRKQLNNINTSLRTLKTELTKVSSEFADNAESEQALIAKNKTLQKSIDQQKKKIEEVAKALAAAEQKFGENSNEALKWQAVLNKSETDLNKLEQELRQNDQALEEMAQGLRDTETGLRNVDSAAAGLDKLGENLGGAVLGGAKALTAAVVGLGAALVGAAESSREYRTNMGKLNTAFTTNGFSASAAKDAYRDLVGVLGESDRSVEAANHLAKLTDNEKDLQTWTDICTGVFATFGDSLPIEGLTEAANETAKVGQVTGPLADALNWAGISEDEFNVALSKCSDEQERQKLIMDTLNGAYRDASKEYKRTNKDVIEANLAQDKLNDSLARLGATIEPLITKFKNFAAAVIGGFAGIIENVTELPKGLQAIVFGFTGLVAAAGPAVLAFNSVSKNIKTFKGVISDLGSLLGKKAAATTADTAATTANTAATTANATATNALAKAKTVLNKALGAGKWIALGAAIAGASVLLYKFATDAEGMSVAVEGIANKAAEMIGKAADMVPKMIEGIQAALPALMDAGVTILTALVDGILQALPAIMEAVPQIIIAIANGIIENLDFLINSAIQIILALVNGIVQAIPTLIAAIPQVMNGILTGIINNLQTIVNGALQIILALIQGLIQALPQLIAYVPQIIAAIVTALLGMIGQIFQVGVQILQKLWSGISSWAGSLYSKVTSFARQLPGKIKSGIGSLVSVGADWVRGLWNGISDKVGWIVNKIKGFGRSCLNAIKDFFGINSPSIVMENEVGKYMAEGVGVGFTKYIGGVTKEIDRSLKGVLASTQRVASQANTPMPQLIDYDRIKDTGAQAIYIDGRLIGRALRQPLLDQGVVMT